jgi:hypothetical protein
VFLFSALALAAVSALPMTPVKLKCEYQVDPLGVDAERPRLSWTLESGRNGARQTAFQIRVGSGAGKTDLWDTGRVASTDTVNIPYAGTPLASSQRVTWSVRVWDENGKPSAWSRPAAWTMGLLCTEDWQAKWITALGAKDDAVRKARGYHALETRQENEVKWVQVDLGRPIYIDQVRIYPMRHAGVAGFGFPLRFRVEASEDPRFARKRMIADFTKQDFPSPGDEPVSLQSRLTARYIRVTATKLWKRDWAYCFALNQIEVLSEGKNVALHAAVSSKDSHERDGWAMAAFTDGLHGDSATKYETVELGRRFTVKPKLRRAIAHVTGLGQYELTLNGQKVGHDLLSPGWTNYRKTVLYDTRDVTSLLRRGENDASILLGNGMYRVHGGRYTKFTGSFGPLRAIAQLRLEYADGTVDVIGTDEHWEARPGPVTFSCIYGGEDFDGRRVGHGDWEPVRVLEGPGGALEGASHAAPPVRAFDVLKPVAVRKIGADTAVYDLGQNASLMPRLEVSGPPGSIVRVTPAELLNPDGSVDRGSVGGGEAYWQYTLRGKGREVYFPKFWYHGSRYLQVERIAAKGKPLPRVLDLEGHVVHTSSAPVGTFESSNELFNQIHTLVRWAQRSNLVSVITDCPHRERLGWLEQYHLNGPSLRYEFDLAQLFEKGMQDMADSQLESGLVPDIAPEYVVFQGGFRDSPEWGSAYILVPWQQYLWTGDVDLLRRHYEGMKRYVAYLGSRSKDRIVSHGLGDWYDIGPRGPGVAQLTPIALTATAFYFQDTQILAQTARLLGKAEEAERYSQEASRIREAFNETFFDASKGYYSTGSQTANAIPLVMGLAPQSAREAVLGQIVRDVQERDNAITSGDVGYRYLLRALADGGRSDLVYEMNRGSDHPGYGYQLKMGATSLTEAWDAGRGSSQNHFMLGQINEWFYHDLAGIAPSEEGPGFRHIVFRPAFVGDLKWVRASLDSIRGRIESSWRRENGAATLDVLVPPNCTATVVLPPESQAVAGSVMTIESGVFRIGSGRYAFKTNL